MALVAPTSSPVLPDARHNSIGFLRLLFAGMVLYTHAWYLAGPAPEPYVSWLFHNVEGPGGIGVKGFFVLSGFLVMRSERRSASSRAFLWGRALRIFPALWLCLIVTGLLFPWFEQLVRPGTGIDWADARHYVWSNWFYPRTQFGVRGLLGHAYLGGDLNGSLWTLPYEIGCYVLLALVGWFGLTQGSARGAWCVGAALLVMYVHDIVRPANGLFFKSGGRMLAAWFIVGALAAVASDATVRRWFSAPVVATLAFAWIATCWWGGSRLVGPVALGGLVLWASRALPLYSFEERLGGDYSYGLYIYGYPVQQMLAEFGFAQRGIGIFFAMSLVITLAFAVGSWHLVEKHALRLKSLFAPLPSKHRSA